MIPTLVLSTLLAIAVDPTPEQRKLLKVFRDEFIAITPGEGDFPRVFSMGRARDGAESPVISVRFDYKFHIAKYEVPQNLWEAVMGSNPSRWKGPRNSVEMLTYTDAQAFCLKATELMRAAKLISERQSIRLPSECEWEYAARAGTTTIYSFGDDEKALDEYGWHTGNAAGNDPPVGAKKPNPWGLYDVHGYLWEWCLDNAYADYKQASGDAADWLRERRSDTAILRGGSWKDRADRLTSSFRSRVPITTRDDAVGLRCVLADAP
jgi:formylglycine-generating enzyme required for sulfatase activity